MKNEAEARLKIRLFGILVVLLSSLASIFGCEFFLRTVLGRQPFEHFWVHPHEPITHEPDPIVGWRNKPGRVVYQGYAPNAAPITLTIQADGSRATGSARSHLRPQVAFFGGSFTRGSAISDHETFAWKLQERYPSVEIANHGVGAYSTYQSLLLLEERFSEPPFRPNIVGYGFVDFHTERNIAGRGWLWMLARHARKIGSVRVPYATISRGGELIRNAPDAYPVWPLSYYSSIITSVQDVYATLKIRRDFWYGVRVTERLLLEMNDLCNRMGSRFIVIYLSGRTLPAGRPLLKRRYLKFLEKEGIEVIDCFVPDPPPKHLRVRNEGHPNGRLNTMWAECIAKGMGTTLRALS